MVEVNIPLQTDWHLEPWASRFFSSLLNRLYISILFIYTHNIWLYITQSTGKPYSERKHCKGIIRRSDEHPSVNLKPHSWPPLASLFHSLYILVHSVLLWSSFQTSSDITHTIFSVWLWAEQKPLQGVPGQAPNRYLLMIHHFWFFV